MDVSETLVQLFGKNLVAECGRGRADFNKIASSHLREKPDGGTELDGLLAYVVEQALKAGNRKGAATAIDAYVADVWPVLLEYRQDRGAAALLAQRTGLLDTVERLTAGRLREFLREDFTAAPAQGSRSQDDMAGAFASSPAPPPPPVPPPPRNDRQVEPERGLSFEEVCAFLSGKNGRKSYKVLMLGFASSGKSFFVRRLAVQLENDYGALVNGQTMDLEAEIQDRTDGIYRYSLDPNGPFRRRIEIFDIPGDKFRDIFAGSGKKQPAREPLGTDGQPVELSEKEKDARDIRDSIYALCAKADAFIIIEPAFMTLAARDFESDGDDICERTLVVQRALHEHSQQREAAAAERDGKVFTPLSKEEIEQRAWDEMMTSRKERSLHHNSFIGAIGGMAKRIVRLRRQRVRFGSSESVEEFRMQVQACVNEQISEDEFVRLPAPMLLLLSRADEYQRRRAHTDFDRDPSLTLLDHAPARFIHYYRYFSAFGCDFITASEMSDAEKRFRRDSRSAGFDRLYEDWLAPAIRQSRIPAPFSQIPLLLQRPGFMIWLRKKLDREFARAWDDARNASPRSRAA